MPFLRDQLAQRAQRVIHAADGRAPRLAAVLVTAVLRDQVDDSHAADAAPDPGAAELRMPLAAPVVEVLVHGRIALVQRRRKPLAHRVVGCDAVRNRGRLRLENVALDLVDHLCSSRR